MSSSFMLLNNRLAGFSGDTAKYEPWQISAWVRVLSIRQQSGKKNYTRILLNMNHYTKQRFAVLAISPDSTLLGVTDTWMNSHFAQSGIIFQHFEGLKAIFELVKTTVLISQFQHKHRIEKWTTPSGDICKINEINTGWVVFKRIFVLKPWNWDGHFEYNKRYKGNKKLMRFLSTSLKICLKNQRLRET